MGTDVLAGLECPNECATGPQDHAVNVFTGEAACRTCGRVHYLEPAEVRDLLDD